MKTDSMRLLVALICGAVSCFAGCPPAKPVATAPAGGNAAEPVEGASSPADEAAGSVPHPDPDFHGKIGQTFHDAQADPTLSWRGPLRRMPRTSCSF
jgi:hypothetical protein